MSGYELRPLSLGELLDRAFLLYRRHFLLFAGIMAIPALALVPARFFYLWTWATNRFRAPVAIRFQAAISVFILLFIDWIVYIVAQAATTHAVEAVYLGRESGTGRSYESFRTKIWRLIALVVNVTLRVACIEILLVVASIAAGVALTLATSRDGIPATPVVVVVFVLVAAGIALGFLFAARYGLAIPALMLENLKAREAIRRSVNLSRRRRGRIAVAAILCVVLSYALTVLLEGPFYAWMRLARPLGPLAIWPLLAMAFAGVLRATIAGPPLMIILTLFYYDARVRDEAFDLHQMLASLPAAAAAPAVQ